MLETNLEKRMLTLIVDFSKTKLGKKPKCSALGQKSYSNAEVCVNSVLASIYCKSNNSDARLIILLQIIISLGVLLKQYSFSS